MAVIIFLAAGTTIFLIIMGIGFRNAPPDPFEKEEDEKIAEIFNAHNSDNQIQVIVDDGEEDEEIDEESDSENEEDQD